MNNLDNTIEILTKSQDQSKYYTVLTLVGLNKIESYYQANKTVTLTHMGFGGLRDTYVEPSESATTVPNQWALLPLERKPADGLLGGGATISNKEEFKGNFIGNVGIYDEDGTLILIASYPLTELAPDASIVSAFPIDIEVYLSNASNVTVETDTNITHPTHDEFHTAIEKLSRYATTEHEGLVELATIEEVNESTDPQLVVTPKTLDKAGLIRQLEEFATQKADDVKQFILGGVPSSSLDTILEIDKALQQTGDAIRSVYETIATKLPTLEFNTFKEWVQSQLSNKLGKTEKAVDSDKLDGFQSDVMGTSSTVPVRDSTGDINARLFKSSYANEERIEGALAFRVNNGADSYIRFCNSKARIRQWLGLTQGNLKIEVGVINDGQTIQMRESGGYNPRFMVSLADSGTTPWDVWEGGIYDNNVPYRTVCKVDGSGFVTAKRYITHDDRGPRVTSCQANYLVMYYVM
ncbi:TPA: phage tail protein [Photobacterium damselae]